MLVAEEWAEFPEDSESLKKIILAERKDHKAEIIRLNELITLLRRRHYGTRSEKAKISSEQLGLFNEVEECASKAPSEESEEKQTITYERRRPKRKPLPENLLREDVVIELSEEERKCHCGCLMIEISEEVSEKLDVIPMQMKVIRTRRKKYACKKCEANIQTAPVPPQILPKSNAAAGLLAFIAVSKYVDALPLYRLESLFLRVGVELSRTTMAHWMIEVAAKLLVLVNLLKEKALEDSYLQSDETRVQVLDGTGKPATSKSWMWVLARAGPEPVVIYTFDVSRSAEVPKNIFEGFEGYLQADGYDAYGPLCENSKVVRVGCFAHCRRKFFEATKVSQKAGLANKGLSFIRKLYAIEEEIRKSSAEERYRIRQEKSKPLLQVMKTWIDEIIHSIPPASALGKALGYASREWVYLVRYIEDGRLQIDNNFVENKIRPFALGRKNWLFSQSVEGAEASALLYSLIETAKANELDPYRYLRYVFEKIPFAKTLEDFEALLPINAQLKASVS